MPRYLLPTALFALGTASVLTLTTPNFVAGSQKGKLPPGAKAAKPAPPTPRKPTPFPGTSFPPYHHHGPMGPMGMHGVSSNLMRMHTLSPSLIASRCPTQFGVMSGLNMCQTCHPAGIFGSGRSSGLGGLNFGPGGGYDAAEGIVADLMAGRLPGLGGGHHRHLMSHGIDPDVLGLLSESLRPKAFGLVHPNSLLNLEDDFSPLGSNPFSRMDPFGRQYSPLQNVFGGFNSLDILRTQPRVYSALPMYSPLYDHVWGPSYTRSLTIFDLGGFGGYPYLPGIGGGGIIGTDPWDLGPGIGGFRPGGFPGGYYPNRRRYPLPINPPVVRGPTKAEQRTALEKFEKSLAGIETLARVGAWSALGTGLQKTGETSGLPAAVTAPLKGIQTEAARLDDVMRLRAAITTEWTTAPDPTALKKHIDAVRTATGDDELAQRLIRLLAVKALWEGHDPVAAAMVGGEVPDLDVELEALRRHRLTGSTKVTPITTDEDRVIACQRAVRELLDEIDRQLDCGRYSVSVHLVDVRSIRGGVTKAAKELAGNADAKPADSFETAAAKVSKALGRELTQTDRLILRRMFTAKKTVEEMTDAIR